MMLRLTLRVPAILVIPGILKTLEKVRPLMPKRMLRALVTPVIPAMLVTTQAMAAMMATAVTARTANGAHLPENNQRLVKT